MSVVLLDTNVAAGILSGLSRSQKGLSKSEAWREHVTNLIDVLPSPSVVIPTPVFYEYACKNKESFDAINPLVTGTMNLNHRLLRYATRSISSRVLIAASRFRVLCKGQKTGDFVDGLIAAYALEGNHCIATQNQRHFPEPYFAHLNVEVAPQQDSGRAEQEVTFLLKPVLKNWIAR